jgi:hypothetical protein
VSVTSENRDRARSLRQRLNDHALDIETLAAEAAAVFTSAGLPAQERWLGLELYGYTSSAEPTSVHDVLGIESGTLADGPKAGASFHHFFVEPVRALVDAQHRARSIADSGTRSIRLDFPPNPSKPYLPVSGEFRVDTFDRILLGLRAVLHLQLGSLVQ